MSKAADNPVLHVILGNQLFPPSRIASTEGVTFFMAEDVGLCTYVRHHKKKIVLFLAAMRSHAEALQQRDFPLIYRRLDPDSDQTAYEDKLAEAIKQTGAKTLRVWEIEDKPFERRIHAFADNHGLELEVLPSPMFLTPRETLDDFFSGNDSPRMASFYQQQRRRLNILVDDDRKPAGGQWSFDADNRKKLPDSVNPPGLPDSSPTQHVADVIDLVHERFGDHPGMTDDFNLPTTRRQALYGLRAFLEQRFTLFGDYEDALSRRDDVLFHSLLSPALNLGLITPDEVIERALEHSDGEDIPLNALEGFVRQIIGWREFIRGVYRTHSETQEQANFFDHHRRLTRHWWDGDTGLPPLDDAIDKANRLGYCHHIERLMVLANLMNLCEIHPHDAHRWFMEMFVDSSEWVMGPNVYGMGLFSDGGIFATKPYICGSNYILKMSDYRRGDWCDVMDGLYWRFIDNHAEFFGSNPRMAVMVRALNKLKPERRDTILAAAERFLDRCTTPQAAAKA
ncbi:cryptochrome/photolyase family protein [Mucisphaera calidilacus]|uniref:Deoxyribodipyrimidine photolyase n=1 Tax=Mucisphaera calidilacus TaxID=2527982 RepID=A0A518BV26_9BACT|nr:cryptochrome/photolyase family protein [Mucisphaera calidilacus]QDU70797.1 deoxyribodipyrimidine photolyase [Mucisphaera calidilacus]